MEDPGGIIYTPNDAGTAFLGGLWEDIAREYEQSCKFTGRKWATLVTR